MKIFAKILILYRSILSIPSKNVEEFLKYILARLFSVFNLPVLVYNEFGAASSVPKEINMKKALITGITGQDGSYLSEFLL